MKTASDFEQRLTEAPREQSLVCATKVLILFLSSAGFFLDGLDAADFLFIGAMIVWLWLSDCVDIERRLIDAVRLRHTRNLEEGGVQRGSNRVVRINSSQVGYHGVSLASVRTVEPCTAISSGSISPQPSGCSSESVSTTRQ